MSSGILNSYILYNFLILILEYPISCGRLLYHDTQFPKWAVFHIKLWAAFVVGRISFSQEWESFFNFASEVKTSSEQDCSSLKSARTLSNSHARFCSLSEAAARKHFPSWNLIRISSRLFISFIHNIHTQDGPFLGLCVVMLMCVDEVSLLFTSFLVFSFLL